MQKVITSYLILLILVLSIICLLLGVTLGILTLTDPKNDSVSESETTEKNDIATSFSPDALTLSSSMDAGMSYIDKMIFLGESTTAHLRARGVLSGGTKTNQVWADTSGTMMLDSKITSKQIVYPDTEESMKIAEAAAKKKPEYLVLSFGLNGITAFASNKDLYVHNYQKLIGAIQAASPNTKILLQTVYPVCQQGSFDADVATLNEYISTLNSWLPEIAAKFDRVRIVDTASVLQDENGMLKTEFDNGDGIHLTTEAYRAILLYLRTHAWNETERNLP